jgi:hypothetical protein
MIASHAAPNSVRSLGGAACPRADFGRADLTGTPSWPARMAGSDAPRPDPPQSNGRRLIARLAQQVLQSGLHHPDVHPARLAAFDLVV